MMEERLLVAGGIALAIGEYDSYTASRGPELGPDDHEANQLWSKHYANMQETLLHNVVSLAYEGRHPDEFNEEVVHLAHSHADTMLQKFQKELHE